MDNSSLSINTDKLTELLSKYQGQRKLVISNLQKVLDTLQNSEEPLHGETRNQIFRLMKIVYEVDLPQLDLIAFDYFDISNPITNEDRSQVRDEIKKAEEEAHQKAGS